MADSFIEHERKLLLDVKSHVLAAYEIVCPGAQDINALSRDGLNTRCMTVSGARRLREELAAAYWALDKLIEHAGKEEPRWAITALRRFRAEVEGDFRYTFYVEEMTAYVVSMSMRDREAPLTPTSVAAEQPASRKDPSPFRKLLGGLGLLVSSRSTDWRPPSYPAELTMLLADSSAARRSPGEIVAEELNRTLDRNLLVTFAIWFGGVAPIAEFLMGDRQIKPDASQLLIPSTGDGQSGSARKLTDTEQTIVDALKEANGRCVQGKPLAKLAGYPYDSNFRGACSELVKAGVLFKSSDVSNEGYGLSS